jgi:hypothetical protein
MGVTRPRPSTKNELRVPLPRWLEPFFTRSLAKVDRTGSNGIMSEAPGADGSVCATGVRLGPFDVVISTCRASNQAGEPEGSAPIAQELNTHGHGTTMTLKTGI